MRRARSALSHALAPALASNSHSLALVLAPASALVLAPAPRSRSISPSRHPHFDALHSSPPRHPHERYPWITCDFAHASRHLGAPSHTDDFGFLRCRYRTSAQRALKSVEWFFATHDSEPMSFFSKLFKGDNAEGSAPAPPTPPPAPPPRTRSESPRKQAEAAQRERERDEAAQKRAETAVNEDAPTIEMAAQRPPAEEAPAAKPAKANANPNATEELVLPADVQAVAAPPPPPPPLAAKGAAAAKTSSPLPAPPPPVGGARERETESSRGMPAARVKTGSAGTAGS